MIWRTLVALLVLALPAVAEERGSALILAGIPGTEEYREKFSRSAEQWRKAAEAGQLATTVLGVAEAQQETRQPLLSALEAQAKDGSAPLWLVLIGHGTVDKLAASFNLPGPDLKAEDLQKALEPFRRPVVLVLAFSASGAWLKPLAHEGRLVLSATRTGGEANYSRLAEYLGQSVTEPGADLDQDGQTSLLEAWLFATRKVAEWYQGEGRLATEHSLLDDTGDGLGTPPDWFKGVRAAKKPLDVKAPVDGFRAHQFHLVPSAQEAALTPQARAERDKLEAGLEALRELKATTPVEEYSRKLEAILVQLARIYEGTVP